MSDSLTRRRCVPGTDLVPPSPGPTAVGKKKSRMSNASVSVDDGVRVQTLIERVASPAQVDPVVIEHGSRPGQALDDADDLAQPQHLADRRAVGVTRLERRHRRRARPLERPLRPHAEFVHRGAVQLVGNQGVEPEKPPGDEARHLLRAQQPAHIDSVSHGSGDGRYGG